MSFTLHHRPIIFRGHAGVIRAMTARWPYVFSGAADHSIKVWDIRDKDIIQMISIWV